MQRLFDLIRSIWKMPRITIDLMANRTVGNDPFYAELVTGFYAEARGWHKRVPLIRAFEWGVALCVLPQLFEDYFMLIEASARRNYKKALRFGYSFRRINCNDHLSEIKVIRCSATVRQGALPNTFLEAEVRPCENPVSLSNLHDYPYFGVFKEGQLVAYGGGMVAGEVFCLEHIYGHAAFHADGVVPMLVIGIAEHLYANFPRVRYYAYGTFLGAGSTLQRFKKKFKFLPHKVIWVLDGMTPCSIGSHAIEPPL